MKKKLLALLSLLSIAAISVMGGCSNTNNGKPDDTDDKQTDTGADSVKSGLVFKGMSASSSAGAGKKSAEAMSASASLNSTQADYSAFRNEEFYINVEFDNPKNYAVLGLTISYAGITDLFPCSSFEEDFDSENVYVRVKAKKSSDTDLLTEYTISNITYSDGEEIKSAAYADNASRSLFVEVKQYGTEVDRTQAVTGTKLNCLGSGMLSAEGVLNVPDGITEIGEYAFAYNESIKEIVIPDTVETVCEGAFYDCLSLEKVKIGSGVKFIDKNAFHNCENINYVNYTGTLTDWCLIDFAYRENEQTERINGSNTERDKNVRYSNPTFFAHDLHINGELVTEVVVPQEIKAIKYATFARCTSITKVVLHENVKTIGFYAFVTCTGINEINLGGVEIIDDSAFNGCYSLTSLTLPSTLLRIKSGAFTAAEKILEIYNLSNLHLEVGLSSNGAVAKFAEKVYSEIPSESNFERDIDGFVWYKKAENADEVKLVGYVGTQPEITVPYEHNGKRVSLNKCAFAGNTVLRKVTFEEGFTEIPNRLFAYCYSINEVVLPQTVERIGDHAFWSCGIKKLELPERCTHIEQHAISECKDLEIKINAKQLVIEKFAFGWNKNLRLTFAGTVEQWNEYVNMLSSNATSKGMLYDSDFTAVCSNGKYKAYGI